MNHGQKVVKQKKTTDARYGEVHLQDPYLERAIDLELAYLNSLEPDRLTAGFYETAGRKPKGKRYGGWEETEIQGHTLGHYLTAVSQAFGYTGKKELEERICYLLDELERCQREDGYLFAWKEEIFDRVEQKEPAWVPWYTMHKIVSGLLSAYRHTGCRKALQIVSKLGSWIARRCLSWNEETQKVVLSVEYGGMNDCLYELYAWTGIEEYACAAHKFDEMFLFESLYENRDVLNGRHANTTIPKILGAVNRYLVMGETEKFYLDAAENFWEMVESHHSYATGGNSEWEHFGQPDVLDAERTSCNCETCNTYNMLKLSKRLFEITGNRKYADYYANASLNAILSSQNPQTGMTMYFQPMATGYFKVYSTPYDSFWCCTGSGMENFTKLHEGIYYEREKELSICRYVSSQFFWAAEGIRFLLQCRIQEEIFTVSIRVTEAEHNKEVNLRLLLPRWLKKTAQVWVNNEITAYEKDWVEITKTFSKEDEIILHFPMTLEVKSLADNTEAVAFMYGPYLLSAGLGKVMMDTTYTGVNVLVPEKEIAIKDYITLDGITTEKFKKDIGSYMSKKPGKLEFLLRDQVEELVFTPHYLQHEERYGIYWLLYEKGSNKLKSLMKEKEYKERLKRTQVDVVPVGNDQYELAHKIRGEKTDSEQLDGHPCRFFKESGWFSYEMNRAEQGMKLCMTVCSADAGSRFEILANENLLRDVCVQEKETTFYTLEFELPKEVMAANKRLQVKFVNKKGICRIFDELYLKKCEG